MFMRFSVWFIVQLLRLHLGSKDKPRQINAVVWIWKIKVSIHKRQGLQSVVNASTLLVVCSNLSHKANIRQLLQANHVD
eukprot:2777429-Amphidinium_carterae.2